MAAAAKTAGKPAPATGKKPAAMDKPPQGSGKDDRRARKGGQARAEAGVFLL